jgi:hypothetical protein
MVLTNPWPEDSRTEKECAMVAYLIFIKEKRTTKESLIFTRRWLPPLSRVIRSRSASHGHKEVVEGLDFEDGMMLL